MLEADRGLDRAWVALVQRACPLPEFTRGLRMLGSRRGGNPEAQGRYFAPLLQARRRLEEEGEPERRLAAFDASVLSERLQQNLQAMASASHPANPPDRRALEAELQEATEALFARLATLHNVAESYRTAADAVRFDAWRRWVGAVADVFVHADRSWSAVAEAFPAAPAGAAARRKRWWRRSRGGAAVLLSAGLTLFHAGVGQ